MGTYRKHKLTIDERLAEAKSQIAKLSRILKSFKDMQRKGSQVEAELEAVAILLKSVRDKYKEKIDEEQRRLEKEVS